MDMLLIHCQGVKKKMQAASAFYYATNKTLTHKSKGKSKTNELWLNETNGGRTSLTTQDFLQSLERWISGPYCGPEGRQRVKTNIFQCQFFLHCPSVRFLMKLGELTSILPGGM